MKRGRPRGPENDGAGQAKPLPGIPKPPAHLSDFDRRVFTRVAKLLDDMGVLSLADGDIIAQYAETYGLGLQHKLAIDANEGGAVTRTKNGYPLLSADYLVWRDCQRACQKLLSDLGMSPASRTRVAVQVQEEADELVEFLKKRRAGDTEQG